jgi:phage gpG-like protein
VTVKPLGIREVQQQLNDIAERGMDPRPVLYRVAEMFREDQRANFARGGRPKWKPVSPEYAARKAREGKGSQVGLYSGDLKYSLINKRDPYNLEVVKKDRLRMGTTNPVANLFGGKHTGRKQPRRKPFALTPSRRREFLQVVQDYLVDGEL